MGFDLNRAGAAWVQARRRGVEPKLFADLLSIEPATSDHIAERRAAGEDDETILRCLLETGGRPAFDGDAMLEQLRAIRAAPKDSRSFVAMERRAELMAAGLAETDVDEFDFDDEAALDHEIDAFRSDNFSTDGACSQAPSEQVTVTADGGRQSGPVGRPRGRGGGLMYPSRNADILAGGGASGRIEVAPNPKANGEAPSYEHPQASMVHPNEVHIDDMARKYGVDPNLIRATVFMESTHGGYGGVGQLAEWLGVAKSRLPMNVNTNYWGDTWGAPGDMKNPRKNIEAGTKMLSAINAAMPGASVAQRATIYNSSGKNKVTDYGARVEAIYNSKLWNRK